MLRSGLNLPSGKPRLLHFGVDWFHTRHAMTVTLHLKPEVEAGLLAQARANGMVLEDYLLRVVEVAALFSSGAPASAETVERSEAVRKMLEFGEKHRLSLGEPVTRAALHEGHCY